MAVQGDEKGTYYMIHIDGEFNARIVPTVRKVVEEALGIIGHTIIILNVSECATLDSTAIGFVVNLQKKLSSSDGRVGFLNPNDHVNGLLRMSGVSQLVSIYKTEEDIEADI